MYQLSLPKYGWRCVLGGEIVYALCLIGGYILERTARGTELHNSLLETLPGFTWGQPSSYLLGAVYVFIASWIFGIYMAWMFNSSIEMKK